jgi:manganese transport protein
VILSLQLSFAVIPLVMFTNDKIKMGELVNSRPFKLAGWTMAAVIALMNAYLVWQVISGTGS